MAVVFISLGANLGPREATCAEAVRQLTSFPEVILKHASAWYESEALVLNAEKQPPYLNQVIAIETSWSCHELLVQLQKIEKKMGRTRPYRWAPRTLDLDILYYDDLVLATPELQLPHPEIARRPFILKPLLEIAPTWRDPKLKKTIQELFDELDTHQPVRRVS